MCSKNGDLELNHVITLLVTVMEIEWKFYHVLLKHEEHLANYAL
jgi:hypothetical protein